MKLQNIIKQLKNKKYVEMDVAYYITSWKKYWVFQLYYENYDDNLWWRCKKEFSSRKKLQEFIYNYLLEDNL